MLQGLSFGLAVNALAPTLGASADARNKIIVSGASGRIGRLTVEALLARGVPAKNLILVSRTPKALTTYLMLGAATRFGDFSKPESLRDAYAGGTRMLLISIRFDIGPRPTAHQRAIDAAKWAGVEHIAYTSWIGLSQGDTTALAVDHLATESLLERSGIAWTFLRHSVYMDNAIPEAALMIAEGRASIPTNEHKVDLVTRHDCAAAAAAVLATPNHDNKFYDIGGPQWIGVREIAAAARAVTGKPIEIVMPAVPSNPTRRASTAITQLTGRAATSLETFFAANKSEILLRASQLVISERSP